MVDDHRAKDDPVLAANGETLGHISSGTQSPTLGKPIAMAYVPAAYASVDTELIVDIRGRERMPMRVCPLPFYRRPK